MFKKIKQFLCTHENSLFTFSGKNITGYIAVCRKCIKTNHTFNIYDLSKKEDFLFDLKKENS